MARTILIDSWTREQLRAQRAQYSPNECCAILLGRDLGDKLVRAENVCPIKNLSDFGQFLMDPQQQMNIVKSVSDGGGNPHVKIAAHYHSHPPGSVGRPSNTDLEMAKRGWNVGIHLIEGDDGLNAFYWNGEEFQIAEIINEL